VETFDVGGEVSVDIPSRIGRAVWLAVAGVGLALAWAVGAVVFGGGAAAHAAGSGDDAPGSGLSTLIGAVDGVAQALTGSGDEGGTAVGAAADVVTTTTTAVVTPTVSTGRAAAADARTGIRHTVGAVSSTSTTAILDTAAEVVKPVAQTPAVRHVVAPLHVMRTLESATSAVDDVLGVAVGAVDGAVTPITASASGAPPHRLGPPPPGADAARFLASAGPPWATLQAWWSAAASAGAHIATTATVATVTAATAAPATLSAVLSLPGVTAVAGSSSSGPAGAGSGAAALVTAGLLFAHRAWVRRRRPGDDLSPAAPVYATDVSPD
jgi:hypothetical protein